MDIKDRRGAPDSKLELEDYSGSLRPDLSYADFSRKQLFNMFLMTQEYSITQAMSWIMYIMEKWGMEAAMQAQKDIWADKMVGPAHNLICDVMNMKGNDLETFMKCFQMDLMTGPTKFNVTFEMPSKDLGVITFYKCMALDMFEPLGDEVVDKMCNAVCPPSNTVYGKSFHPDMEYNILKIPPRKDKNDICCKWEFYIKK